MQAKLQKQTDNPLPSKARSYFETKTQGIGTLLQDSPSKSCHLQSFNVLLTKNFKHKQKESKKSIWMTTQFCKKTATSKKQEK